MEDGISTFDESDGELGDIVEETEGSSASQCDKEERRRRKRNKNDKSPDKQDKVEEEDGSGESGGGSGVGKGSVEGSGSDDKKWDWLKKRSSSMSFGKGVISNAASNNGSNKSGIKTTARKSFSIRTSSKDSGELSKRVNGSINQQFSR